MGSCLLLHLPNHAALIFNRRTFRLSNSPINVEMHIICTQHLRIFSPTVVHYLQHFSDRYHLMLSPGTGASVNISVSHPLQQQLLHTKKLHLLTGARSEAECVGCGSFVLLTSCETQQCGRQTGTRATCSTHLNSCTVFFQTMLPFDGCWSGTHLPHTDASVLFCLFTVSDTCVMHFVVWKGEPILNTVS